MASRERMVGALAAGVAAAALLAAPAFAHVEVEADKAQVGAANVTPTFHGEAESHSASIVSERVVLPQGIRPADVTLVKAPQGWTTTSSADGFTIADPALKVGQDAEFAVTVTQLPADASRCRSRPWSLQRRQGVPLDRPARRGPAGTREPGTHHHAQAGRQPSRGH
jgi:hypothetical protein